MSVKANALVDKVLEILPPDMEPSSGFVFAQNPFDKFRADISVIEEVVARVHEIRPDALDLAAHDFPSTHRLWRSGDVKERSRIATGQVLGWKRHVNSYDSWTQTLPSIIGRDFHNPANRFGTRFEGMLSKVYEGIPFSAIKDLVQHDIEFTDYQDLAGTDMRVLPRSEYPSRKEVKTAMRGLVLSLINTVQRLDNCSMDEACHKIGTPEFYSIPINRYGTTAIKALRFYGLKPFDAIADAVSNDEKLNRKIKLLPKKRRQTTKHTWLDADGNGNYPYARSITAQLQEIYGPVLTRAHFIEARLDGGLSGYGGMLTTLYRNNASVACAHARGEISDDKVQKWALSRKDLNPIKTS